MHFLIMADMELQFLEKEKDLLNLSVILLEVNREGSDRIFLVKEWIILEEQSLL